MTTEQPRQGTIQVEAKTLELALQKAALTLGVSQERLGYEVTKDSGSGIMSLLTGRRVQLTAWRKASTRPPIPVDRPSRGDRSERSEKSERSEPRSSRGGERGDRYEQRPRRDAQRPAPRHQEYDNDDENQVRGEDAPPARQLTTEEVDALREEIKTFWQDICQQMSGESVEVTSEVTEGRLTLRATNEYLAGQLTKNSKLAEAFEHVLRKKPRHLRQELPFRIFVDINDIRKNREEELVSLAKDLSAQVHENRKPIVLNYKSPYERKIIHMALDKDERVYTKSIGSGSGRKLMILPIGDEGQNVDAEEYAEG